MAVPAAGSASTPPVAADPTTLVDVFTGTGGEGGTFPGAALPFGMVQLSPNTDNARGGGYSYDSPVTWGFGHNHLSGPGCPAMGDVVLLPVPGPTSTIDPTLLKTPFSHAEERGAPGYYAVKLASRAVVELTATERTGWHRYGFPAGWEGSVVVAPGRGLRGAYDAAVDVVAKNVVEGWVSSHGFFNTCGELGANRYTMFFSARFSRPFGDAGAGTGATAPAGVRQARGPTAGAWLRFAPHPRPLVVKVGISYVSVEGARANLAAEARGFDFDAVAKRARGRWRGLLGRIQIAGGQREARRTFYTALYHSLLHPNVFSDADGRYVGFDGAVHVAKRHPHYTNFSLWDTYRGQHQLLGLVVPERVPAMVSSLLVAHEHSGFLPKWPYARYETNEMVGDPAVPVLVDAYLKGLLPRERVAQAYEAMIDNATTLPPFGSDLEGRVGLGEYLNVGYVPFAGRRYVRGASSTLEYALADCALSLMARALGKKLDADRLVLRSQNYRTLIDGSRFVRPRLRDGSFLQPFDPDSHKGFAEGSAWQYTWLVPHDVPGLVEALGGREQTLAKLDTFFATGRYNPGNEHDLQAPYLYDYLGEPWKTQHVVHDLLRRYETSPTGIPGNDDLGALSSWYVLSALGLYPVFAGADFYALTRPLFDRAVIRIGAARSSAKLVIRVVGGRGHLRGGEVVSTAGPRIRLRGPWVSDAAIRRGGTLSLRVGRPGGWDGGAPEPPPAPCAEPVSTSRAVVTFRDAEWTRLSLGQPTVFTARAENTGPIPLTGVTATIHLPAGWRAQPVQAAIPDLAPGMEHLFTWVVHPPRDATPGDYELRQTLAWSTPEGRSRAFSTLAVRRVELVR